MNQHIRLRRGRVRAGLQGLLFVAACSLAFGACLIEKHDFDEKLADCTDYCGTVLSRCTDQNRVYDRTDTCMAVCLRMDSGVHSPGGSAGNTLACRLDLLSSGFEPGVAACDAAGPGGGGKCGSDCDAFCALRQQLCANVPGQDTQKDVQNDAECQRECQALVSGPFPSPESLAAAHDEGDTLQCRLMNLSEVAANPSSTETFCRASQANTADDPDPPCSDSENIDKKLDCSTYCHLVQAACTSDLQVYESTEQCQAVCAVLDRGSEGDMDQNTIRCRRYHSYNALAGPEEHCTHAGPTGDGTCGTDQKGTGNCHAYCQILKGGCATKFASTYGGGSSASDLGSCPDTCEGIAGSKDGAFANATPRYAVQHAPTGDNLLCRTFHAVHALASAPDSIDECSAAFGDAGSVCGPPAPSP